MARTAREIAAMRAIMQEESRSLRQGDMNTSGMVGAEYPRMLYRKTDEPEEQVISTHADGRPRETLTINSFNGLLCETTIANDADEAEQLASEGWDTTPQAAHGMATGMIAATTAKDERIAELEAQLAAMQAEPAKRGPGRPPKQDALASTNETV